MSFEGTQFILSYTGHKLYGDMKIYIDGGLAHTLNQYSPTTVWQSTWASDVFSYDTHTVELVHASGAYVDIDAVEILP